MFYYDVLKEFHDNNIRYLIVGGLSVNLHGIPRVTQDIDIIIAMDEINIHRTIAVLEKLGYCPRLPVKSSELADNLKREKWVSEKNLKAFTFYHPHDHFKVIDILLVHPLDFEESYKSREEKQVKNFVINLVSIDDLIVMKEYSGRSQDLSDIEMLKKLKVFMADQYGR